MPTVGLVCACAGAASATAPSAMADRADLSRFMVRSQSVEPQSPRYRGLLLAPVRADASSGSIRADGNGIIDYRLQFCKPHKTLMHHSANAASCRTEPDA